MTDSPAPRRSRMRGAVLVAVLLVVIAAVVVIALVTAGAKTPDAAPSAPEASSTQTASRSASSPRAATAKPSSARRSAPSSSLTRSSSPMPQPTKTAAIATSAPIRQELTAQVTKTEAVQGKASGPGEIAGPAVRFTITITNATGKSVDLANTVVNAYYGSGQSPAIELDGPGGKAFPATVRTGSSAAGVFVFNMPTDERGDVTVTVDSSARNPVVAFKGAAPK